MDNYISASPEQGQQFYHTFKNKGKIVMLNLMRFKELADYSSLEAIAPESPISGKEAYTQYLECVLPLFTKAGAKVLFYGNAGAFLIGPGTEFWDAMLLVEHQSVAEFMKFANDEAYLKIAGHRTAALEDSRLLPHTENSSIG